jgi:hypothetical protein
MSVLNRGGDSSALCLQGVGGRIEEAEGGLGHGGWTAKGSGAGDGRGTRRARFYFAEGVVTGVDAVGKARERE